MMFGPDLNDLLLQRLFLDRCLFDEHYGNVVPYGINERTLRVHALQSVAAAKLDLRFAFRTAEDLH